MKSKARCFGQDLMRREHIVGQTKNGIRNQRNGAAIETASGSSVAEREREREKD